MISFIAKYYLCDQIKTDETSGGHCTNGEEVKIRKKNYGEETRGNNSASKTQARQEEN